MAVKAIHAFLVQPGRGITSPPAISGKKLPHSGDLYELLRSIFVANPDKRDFEVMFKIPPSGAQQNDCRDEMVAYSSLSSLANGQKIAERLQAATDARSGIGLLFLIAGTNGLKQRLVVSRFPANEAILAETGSGGLDLQFLKQVFIRRFHAYKALLLEDSNPSAGFWSGMVTDRQAGGTAENISHYWMSEFLSADFSETAAEGTRRLAEALKKAVKLNPNLEVKSEIASAVTLAKSVFTGQATSINGFCDHFGFSESTKKSIIAQLPKQSLAAKTFSFDPNVFKERLPYRTVEIENGAILTAPSANFTDVFHVEEKPNGIVEYSTSGKVHDERLMKK